MIEEQDPAAPPAPEAGRSVAAAPRRQWELALAIIVKDERAYLEEWVAYHQAIGVQHMFVYDHGSTDGTRESLARWVNRGVVTVIDWPRLHGQFDAYEHAIRLATGMTEWLGIIDTDEFICQAGPVPLRAHLRTLGHADQLLIRWRWFGHGGHRDRPTGLVTENYDRVRPQLSDIVKSIFRPETVVQAGVHVQRTRSGRTVDLTGRAVPEGWRLPHAATGDEPFQVNHYYCRSYEEYLRKMTRGDANVNKQQEVRPFEAFDFDGTDRRLVDFAPRLRERMRAMARLPEDPIPSGSLGGGVSPASVVALHHLLRDRLLEEAEGLGAEAAFAKSDLGIRVRFVPADGDEPGLVERLQAMLAHIGGWWGAKSAGTLLDAPAAERFIQARPRGRVRDSLFEGHLFAVLLLRNTEPGAIRYRLSAKVEGEPIREVGRVRVRDPGLWVAIQRLGERPSVPFALRFDWSAETGITDLLDARLWFIS